MIINDFLKEFTLKLLDLSLEGFILMFSVSLLIFLEQDITKEVTKRFLFIISLLNTTIQDSSKKEKSNKYYIIYISFINIYIYKLVYIYILLIYSKVFKL